MIAGRDQCGHRRHIDGARSITAVEINPIINDVVSRRMRDRWGGLFEQPEVKLVTEDEIKDGFRFLYGRMKLACEPAGAATAAALLADKIELEPGQTVAAVVSGGNVAGQTAAAILAEQ